MRAMELNVSNGTLDLPQEILDFLNLKDGEIVCLETNDDSSVTIRKKHTIANLKGILKKGEAPDLHADKHYQFHVNSNRREES